MTAVMMFLSAGEAQRLTQRIKLTASNVRDNLVKLRNLVEEARNSNAWSVLGFQSWTAYLADTLADEPMRLGREERQELVGYLAGEGLSTRAIAPIVGVSPSTVKTDVQVASSGHLAEVVDAEILEEPTPAPRPIIGLDGKTYAAEASQAPRRKPLTDDLKAAGWDARKSAERLQKLAADDRFTRNKEEVAALIRGHLMFTVEVCQDLLDTLNQEEN